MISQMVSYMIGLTRSGWFIIINYFKIDFSLNIYYLTYLTFSTNLFNQLILNQQYYWFIVHYLLKYTYIGKYILTY